MTILELSKSYPNTQKATIPYKSFRLKHKIYNKNVVKFIN